MYMAWYRPAPHAVSWALQLTRCVTNVISSSPGLSCLVLMQLLHNIRAGHSDIDFRHRFKKSTSDTFDFDTARIFKLFTVQCNRLLHCTVNNLKIHAVSELIVNFLNRCRKSMSKVPSST